MPPLVRQCQKGLNDISTRHTVWLYWVPGHAGMQGNEIAGKLAKGQFCSEVCTTGAFMGVSRKNIRRKIKRWMDNQHMVMWHVLAAHKGRLKN